MAFRSLFLASLFFANFASASIITFTDEAAFNAASAALATQTFAGIHLVVPVTPLSGPLDTNTNNAVVGTGAILPGISFTTLNPVGGNELGMVRVNAYGNPNQALFNNHNTDSLVISFDPTVTAVGLSLLSPSSFVVDVTTAGPGGSSLGSKQNVTINPSGEGVFFGLIATGGDRIFQVTLFGESNAGEHFAGVDRVTFGQAAAVPEPATMSLLLTGALGLFHLRSRRANA